MRNEYTINFYGVDMMDFVPRAHLDTCLYGYKFWDLFLEDFKPDEFIINVKDKNGKMHAIELSYVTTGDKSPYSSVYLGIPAADLKMYIQEDVNAAIVKFVQKYVPNSRKNIKRKIHFHGAVETRNFSHERSRTSPPFNKKQ